LERENLVLASTIAQLSHRLDELEADRRAELAEYEEREAALCEFAKTLPEPPDYGTDDPWEIARLAGRQLTPDEIETFFDED
jgi:cell division protein FtsB